MGDMGDVVMVMGDTPYAGATWPTAPSYDFTHRPVSIASVDASELRSDAPGDFFRQARW